MLRLMLVTDVHRITKDTEGWCRGRRQDGGVFHRWRRGRAPCVSS